MQNMYPQIGTVRLKFLFVIYVEHEAMQACDLHDYHQLPDSDEGMPTLSSHKMIITTDHNTNIYKTYMAYITYY